MPDKLNKVVDLPEFEEIKGEEIGKTLYNLLAFFIPEDMERPVRMNPTKIHMNNEDCAEFIKLIQQDLKRKERLKVNLMWLNQGPSGDEEVPRGKVYLYHSYVKSVNEKEETGYYGKKK